MRYEIGTKIFSSKPNNTSSPVRNPLVKRTTKVVGTKKKSKHAIKPMIFSKLDISFVSFNPTAPSYRRYSAPAALTARRFHSGRF